MIFGSKWIYAKHQTFDPPLKEHTMSWLNVQWSGNKLILSILGLRACFRSGLEQRRFFFFFFFKGGDRFQGCGASWELCQGPYGLSKTHINTYYYFLFPWHDYFMYQTYMFTTHIKYILDYCELNFVKMNDELNKIMKMTICKCMHIKNDEE